MTSSPDDPGAPPTTTGTVLYIDDNPSNIRLISRIFERAGDVRLVPAMLGQIGLELALDQPDLILLDLNLPDMSGEEVLARLRADPASREIPVVVMSADATPGIADRVAAMGARAFVAKPITITDFLEVTGRFLPSSPPAQVDDA